MNGRRRHKTQCNKPKEKYVLSESVTFSCPTNELYHHIVHSPTDALFIKLGKV
jgi:hypothetical protein